MATEAQQKLAAEAEELAFIAAEEARKAADLRKQQEIQLALIEQLKLAMQEAQYGETLQSAQQVMEQQAAIEVVEPVVAQEEVADVDQNTFSIGQIEDIGMLEASAFAIDTSAISAALNIDLNVEQ